MHIFQSSTYWNTVFTTAVAFTKLQSCCVKVSPGTYPGCHGDNISTRPFALLNWCQISASQHSSLCSRLGCNSDFIRNTAEGQHWNLRQLLGLYDCFLSAHLMGELIMNSRGNDAIHQDLLPASSSKKLWWTQLSFK